MGHHPQRDGADEQQGGAGEVSADRGVVPEGGDVDAPSTPRERAMAPCGRPAAP
jgi:hypothetical protein